MKKILFLLILIIAQFSLKAQRPVHKNDTIIYVIKKPKVDTPQEIKITKQTKLDSLTNEWKGKPYVYGGTSKSGIDCSGFTQMTYKALFDYILPRTAREQFLKAIKVSLDDIKVGDLLFFMSPQSPSGWHVAFYLGDNKYIHAANRKAGVVIQELTLDVKKRIYSVGRYIQN